MIRNTLEAGSANVYSAATLDVCGYAQYRSEFGQGTSATNIVRGNEGAPCKVRLRRVGNVVTYGRAPVGQAFEDYLEQTWPGNDEVFVGMAVTSHRVHERATAILKNWRFTQL